MQLHSTAKCIQVATEVIVEDFDVGFRVGSQAIVNDLAELIVGQHAAERAMQDLTTRFSKALTDGDVFPHFQILAFQGGVIRFTGEWCIVQSRRDVIRRFIGLVSIA